MQLKVSGYSTWWACGFLTKYAWSRDKGVVSIAPAEAHSMLISAMQGDNQRGTVGSHNH